ncbi:MAG: hypothetical protein Q7J47_00580 [Azoarcus sp.]|nr:hypothetical protein [Azoarcus sp.]
MSEVIILGAGPAACLLGIALVRHGIRATLIGRLRPTVAVEGLSHRVADGLRQAGCTAATALLGPQWKRVSCWAGANIEMNGEFAVDRRVLDAALIEDARRAGCELHMGTVRGLTHVAEGCWVVHWESPEGQQRTASSPLVVECRGSTAPKVAADRHISYELVALCRTFEGAIPQPRTTMIESFREGWAWGGGDGHGAAHVQIVTLPARVSAAEGGLERIHTAGLDALEHFPSRFGRLLRPAGPVRVRGIRPTLRGVASSVDYLRVGDAAYMVDPLSGHGMFEAISGALAAAPVVNTLLRRPDARDSALKFFESRMEAVFGARSRAAYEHYLSETRWPGSAFWQAVTRSPGHASTEASPSPRFERRPVVEDGFIEERWVAVTPDAARGVRFVEGVDLFPLAELIRSSHRPPCIADLARQLCHPPPSIGSAWCWLQERDLVAHALAGV